MTMLSMRTYLGPTLALSLDTHVDKPKAPMDQEPQSQLPDTGKTASGSQPPERKSNA